MHRLTVGFAVALCASSAVFAPARGQGIPEVRVATPVSGRLHADSAQVTYRFTAAEGDRLGLTMRSDSFDTVLEVVRLQDGEWASVGANDDADGTNSRLHMVIDAAGEYRILARAYEEGSEGPFILEMTSETDPTCCASSLSVGVDLPGLLEDDDRATETGARFDPYLIRGRAGQQVVVTLRASGFAPRVRIGRWSAGAFQELAAGSAGASESRAVLRIPADGDYLVMAAAADASARGPYRIAMDPGTSR